MKFLQRIMQKMAGKEDVKPLGRWNITYCEKAMNQKIDLSNEDHCGPCGQYRMDKMSAETTKLLAPVVVHVPK